MLERRCDVPAPRPVSGWCVACASTIGADANALPQPCHIPEQGRSLALTAVCWHPPAWPRAPAILFQGCELLLWHCYKYQSDAISIPAPAGLEACPCRFLKLFLAHLDAFHPVFSVVQPVNRYVE